MNIDDENFNLMDHLKDHIKQTKNKVHDEPMSASQAVTILSQEEEVYVNHTRDLVEWRRLSVEERIQQRLSGTPLSQRIVKIDAAAVDLYWECALDTDLIREYLDQRDKMKIG